MDFLPGFTAYLYFSRVEFQHILFVHIMLCFCRMDFRPDVFFLRIMLCFRRVDFPPIFTAYLYFRRMDFQHIPFVHIMPYFRRMDFRPVFLYFFFTRYAILSPRRLPTRFTHYSVLPVWTFGCGFVCFSFYTLCFTFTAICFFASGHCFFTERYAAIFRFHPKPTYTKDSEHSLGRDFQGLS